MSHSFFAPLERLLTSGGDTRLVINPQTGRNRYECLPQPSDIVPFGSCTSSPISARGLAAAQEVHRVICSSSDSFLAANDYANTVRRRLQKLLTLPDDVDVALAPSGTDVELLALALAAGATRRPVVNILVGPGEVGSGTPQAAACCHYDELAPSGIHVKAGEPVDPALASLVDVRTVDLRLATGEMHSESEIDAAVIELFVEASEADAIVLLHIVAHSKTGVHAPSLACAEKLRKTSEDVVVVVDAAQGRFSRRGLRDVLKNDYLVMFTGSKFYGGPPFSGALLVPSKYRPANREVSRLPEGFGAYFTAAEMPETWPEVREHLPRQANYGAILRWSAALAEIEAYYRAPKNARLRVLRFFEAEVPRIFGASSVIRLLPIFPPVYDDTAERLLESKTTVFGFWITPLGAQRPLGKADLKWMHSELTLDCSERYPSMDRSILRRKYHVGQPVDLGPAGSVLRVALGGELITRVSTDRNLGASLDDRLAWLQRELVGLRQKIECLTAVRAASQAPAAALASAGHNARSQGSMLSGVSP